MSVNKVILLGNLGRDPELRYTPKGTAVCKISLACAEKYKDNAGQWQERTEWINCIAWGALGERCNENLAKGAKVYVEGKLTTRSWEKDGQKHYTTEVTASWVEWFSQGRKAAEQGPATDGMGKEIDDSDIPF